MYHILDSISRSEQRPLAADGFMDFTETTQALLLQIPSTASSIRYSGSDASSCTEHDTTRTTPCLNTLHVTHVDEYPADHSLGILYLFLPLRANPMTTLYHCCTASLVHTSTRVNTINIKRNGDTEYTRGSL